MRLCCTRQLSHAANPQPRHQQEAESTLEGRGPHQQLPPVASMQLLAVELGLLGGGQEPCNRHQTASNQAAARWVEPTPHPRPKWPSLFAHPFLPAPCSSPPPHSQQEPPTPPEDESSGSSGLEPPPPPQPRRWAETPLQPAPCTKINPTGKRQAPTAPRSAALRQGTRTNSSPPLPGALWGTERGQPLLQRRGTPQSKRGQVSRPEWLLAAVLTSLQARPKGWGALLNSQDQTGGGGWEECVTAWRPLG